MRPIICNWPVSSNTSIALLQTLAGAGTLKLNGPLVNPGSNIPAVQFVGITRAITLTSTNDLSGVNFTIKGYFNGAVLSEVLAGPNNGTVTSANIYDGIYSITTNGAAAAVSVGTATTGRTKWINFDYDMLVPNYSVQVAVTGTINYTFKVTLDDASSASPTLSTPVVAMTAATTTQLAYLTNPIKWMNVTVNSSDGTGAIVATFLQQGIAS